MTKHIVTKVVW